MAEANGGSWKVLGVDRKRALEMGVSEAKLVDPQTIITAEWVRMEY